MSRPVPVSHTSSLPYLYWRVFTELFTDTAEKGPAVSTVSLQQFPMLLFRCRLMLQQRKVDPECCLSTSLPYLYWRVFTELFTDTAEKGPAVSTVSLQQFPMLLFRCRLMLQQRKVDPECCLSTRLRSRRSLLPLVDSLKMVGWQTLPISPRARV